jgi:signal transduction histidine kinase
MKTLRIRKFMVIGMLSVVVFPWFVYFVIHFHFTKTMQNQQNFNEMSNMIANHSSEWVNPEWRKKLQKQLAQMNMNAEIYTSTNQPILKVGRFRGNPWVLNQQQFTVLENGKVIGVVKLYSREKNDTIARVFALIAMFLGIFFVGFQMRRSVVKPLEAMSGSARRIAEGDFDLHLPISRVTEIAEVRTGFEVMVAGLKESFQKQAKLEEERRFIIGAIAHDLRTPLFALRGYLDGLEQGIAASPEKVAKYVSVCKEKSEQLDRLVSDLFAFTKLEYMEQVPNLEKIDFGEIVARSIDSFMPLAQEKSISIIVIPTPYICEVNGDSHLLERALNNLLDNGLRHTPYGGKVIVQWAKDSGKLVITVRDTGSGFLEEDLKHVFEPLYRGEESRNRTTGGAGLGLTIARRIFKAHGGELAASNALDEGAVLTGWLLT